MVQPYLVILPSENRGRGVFTMEAIGKGEIIEIAPVVVMNEADRPYLDKTLLHDYIFEWPGDDRKCCMALGYVPIYNHAYEANCEYEMDRENHLMTIKTVRAIAKGEELFLNYNGEWNDPKPVWFEAS
jgi:SET domain-containing protein